MMNSCACRKVFITPLELYEALEKVESKIKGFVGADPHIFIMEHTKYDETYKKVKHLLKERQSLLDSFFLSTPEEIARFGQINLLLDKLTKKMYRRTASLYRTLLAGKDKDFDDDYEVVGSIKCVVDYDSTEGCCHTILHLPTDDYYGSDFEYMISLINVMQDIGHIVECHISYQEAHVPSMNDKEFECYDHTDDGVSWAEGQLNREEFKDICICYATHVLCVHNDYSIPDLLRLNNFWVEAQIICQHIVVQEHI